MKFSKPGYSLMHPTESLKKNWLMALHDPLFIFVVAALIIVWAFII
jgi:hypothetical protein